MSVNKVILVGHLGQNPEVKNTTSGMSVANLSIATNETWTDKNQQKQEKTEWHRVVVYGRLAEICGQYLTKGRQVYCEGRIQTRQWQDKNNETRYTTEIIATAVQFLGGNASASQGTAPSYQNNNSYNSGPSSGASFQENHFSSNMNSSFNSAPHAPMNTSSFGEAPSFTEEDIPF